MANRITLDNLHNTRDLCGYETIDGKKIMPHKLIRSGTLIGASSRDIDILVNTYELNTVIDFRTGTEVAEKPDPVIEGVKFIHNPIISEETMGITKEEEVSNDSLFRLVNDMKKTGATGREYMAKLYMDIIDNEYSVEQYKQFFKILLEQEEGACLWHCTAGKDRVGVGTALLLYALNVDMETIIADYLATNIFTKEGTDKEIEKISAVTDDIELIESFRAMFQVERSYIVSVFEEIERRYESVNKFMAERLDLTDANIDILREKYLA